MEASERRACCLFILLRIDYMRRGAVCHVPTVECLKSEIARAAELAVDSHWYELICCINHCNEHRFVVCSVLRVGWLTAKSADAMSSKTNAHARSWTALCVSRAELKVPAGHWPFFVHIYQKANHFPKWLATVTTIYLHL